MPIRAEPKVKAASGSAGIAGLALWALGHYVFHGHIPPLVDAAAITVGPGASAFVAGWWARHIDRPATTPAQPEKGTT